MTPAIKTLQRLRQLELDRCQIALGNARRQARAVQDRLEKAREIQSQQLKELESLTSQGPVTVSRIRVRHDHLADIGVQVQELHSAITTAGQEIQMRIDALVAAEIQLKVAEKLQERQGHL